MNTLERARCGMRFPALLVALAYSGAVHAQTQPAAPAPQGAPGSAATVAGQPLPGPAAPGTPTPGVGTPPVPGASGSAGDSVQGVQLPDVKDPMLEPVPDAANQLTSWKDALALVRTRATALRISQAEIQRQSGLSRQALGVALPRLNGSATYQRYLTERDAPVSGVTSAFFPTSTLTALLDLRIPVLNPKAWYDAATARERVKGAELAAKDSERVLLAVVAQAAVTVVTTSRVAESSRVSLAAALSTLDLTKRRYALGAASAVDVLRAEQEVSLSRAQVVSADEALRQAREALGSSLGDPRGWGVAETVRIEDLEATAQNICRPVQGLDERADIKAAQKTVDVARRDRNSVDYSFSPTVDLFGQAQWNRDEERTATGKNVNFIVGAQLNWALYDGGIRYGQRRSTEAAATVAQQQLVQAKRDATIEITQADRAILVAQTNVEVATRTRDLAKENARLTRLAFLNGSGTSFDLVTQARALREAEIDLLVKDFGLFQAKLTSYLAKANCAL